MTDNVYQAPFYVPPRVSTPYSGKTIGSGNVVLYKDASWDSAMLEISTTSSQYPEGHDFSFSGTSLQDEATWIAFNLPVGTVCTLFKNITDQPVNPYNFAGAGVCVDLIGNGGVQTVDLVAYGANDCLSGGIWRTVNASEGWFQLFAATGCSGSFITVFLDEWPTSTANSLQGWNMDQAASSINYPCLTPVQILTLSANTDGSGQQQALGAANPFRSCTNAATANFTDSGMNDKIRSFSYTVIEPQKAVIDEVSVTFTATIPPGNTFNTSISGTNSTSTPVQVEMQLGKSQTYSVSTTSTLEYSMCVSISTTVTSTAGVPDVDFVSASTTMSFSASAASTSSNTSGSSDTLDLGEVVTFTAPAYSNYSATASISIGNIPMTTVTTNGKFYYSTKLPGSVQEGSLYVLNSPVVVNVAGGVKTTVTFDATSTPIPVAA